MGTADAVEQGRRAREYLRVSLDRLGRGRSLEEQHADHVREERKKKLSTPSVLRGLIEPGADVTLRWQTAPISTRREIARVLLTPNLIGQLRLQPASRRGRHRTPAQERTQWWRG